MSVDDTSSHTLESLVVRPCGLEEVRLLALVAAATFLESFAGRIPAQAIVAHCLYGLDEAAIGALLAGPKAAAWLAEVDKAPVGYTMLTAPDLPIDLQPGDLELKRIYLFSRFHASGLGQTMMKAALQRAREQGASRLLLGVHPENHRAIAFYSRNGFTRIGTRLFKLGESTFEDPVLAKVL